MSESNVRVEVCKSCKRLFHTMTKGNLCPDCKVEEDDEFRGVKQYIREHKGAGIEEVSRECGVSHKQILQWVREERLYFSDQAKVQIPCLNCGKMISMGKYCSKCVVDMKDQFSAKSNPLDANEPKFTMKSSNRLNYHSQNKR